MKKMNEKSEIKISSKDVSSLVFCIVHTINYYEDMTVTYKDTNHYDYWKRKHTKYKKFLKHILPILLDLEEVKND